MGFSKLGLQRRAEAGIVEPYPTFERNIQDFYNYLSPNTRKQPQRFEGVDAMKRRLAEEDALRRSSREIEKQGGLLSEFSSYNPDEGREPILKTPYGSDNPADNPMNQTSSYTGILNNTSPNEREALLGNSINVEPEAVLTQEEVMRQRNNQGALSGEKTVTQNKRDVTGDLPSQISGREMMLRMGLAGMRGATDGWGASMGAMGDQYGSMEDYNRGQSEKAFEIEESRRKAILDRQSAERIAAEERQGDLPDMYELEDGIARFDLALGYLEDENLTGFLAGTLGAVWDKATGSPRDARRLLLQQLKVDDALARVQKTKGAISNKEMELFLQPAPDLKSQESTWREWIMVRRNALVRIQNRVSTGNLLNDSESASASQFASYEKKMVDTDPEVSDLVNKYLAEPTNKTSE